MKHKLKPCLSILPQNQRKLWPELKTVSNLGFILYGGTALSLRLGHRESVDFDFFSEKPLDKEALKEGFPLMKEAETLQDEKDTWVALVRFGDSKPVKISFFGSISFGRVGEPDITDDLILEVASYEDLMATKLKVLLQRVEKKDYCDIAAMIRAGVSLSQGLASARQLFGQEFQPSEALKALTYFKGGDLNELNDEDKRTLFNAAKKVRGLPVASLMSSSLSGKSETLVMDDLAVPQSPKNGNNDCDP